MRLVYDSIECNEMMRGEKDTCKRRAGNALRWILVTRIKMKISEGLSKLYTQKILLLRIMESLVEDRWKR